eukprot:1160439-Pelagomonas_calceolata.AAC.5
MGCVLGARVCQTALCLQRAWLVGICGHIKTKATHTGGMCVFLTSAQGRTAPEGDASRALMAKQSSIRGGQSLGMQIVPAGSGPRSSQGNPESIIA